MPAHRQPLPADLRRRPFTVAQGAAAGLSEQAMRHPSLRAPFRGVRVPPGLPDDLASRCAAALLLMPPGSALAGPTAAALWGLPVRVDRVPPGAAVVHVRIPDGAPRPQVRGTRVRVGLGARPVLRRGLPLVQPSEAWADLGPVLALDDLVVVGDAVARLDRSLARLRGQLERPRLPGRRRLAAALLLVRVGVDSPQETRTRLLLVRAGIPEPEVNREAFDDAGGWLGEIDLGWHDVKVAVEYLGDVHRTQRGRWRRDVRRREVLEANGWRVLFATGDDLKYGQADLVGRVRSALWARGRRW